MNQIQKDEPATVSRIRQEEKFRYDEQIRQIEERMKIEKESWQERMLQQHKLQEERKLSECEKQMQELNSQQLESAKRDWKRTAVLEQEKIREECAHQLELLRKVFISLLFT